MSKKRKIVKSNKNFFASNAKGLHVDNFGISQVGVVGGSMSKWAEIADQVASVMVAVLMIAQIRAFNPGVPPSAIDALPSVKFFKKLIVGPMGTLFASIIAVGRSLDLVDLSVEDAVYKEVQSTFNNHRGNSSFIEQVTERNIGPYRNGVISRTVGLLQGCPVSNMGALGIDIKSVSELDLGKALALIGFGTVDGVKAVYQQELEGKGGRLVLDEPPVLSPVSLNGKTKLEDDIFGDTIVRTQDPSVKTAVGFGGMIQYGSVNRQVIDDHLTPTERLQYQMAFANGNQPRLKALNELAVSRYQSKVTENPNSAIPGAVEQPLDLDLALVARKVKATSNKPVILAGINAYWPEFGSMLDEAKNSKAKLYKAFTFAKSVDKNKVSLDSIVQKNDLGLIFKE